MSRYWRLLRGNRNFRLLWFAQIVSELGDWFYSVAIFSFLLQLTGSAQLVAYAFLMQVLPQTLIAPAAGVINDRLSRKQVMICADLARAAIVLAMLLVRSRGTLWLLFALLFCETVCWGFFEPGRSAVIPNITSPEEIAAANALSSTTWSINFAIGAALSGLAMVTLGLETVFVLNSLSFLGSAWLIRRMRFEEPHAQNRPPLRARDLFDFSEIAEGARYLARDRRLLATVLVKGGIGLMGANWVILPVLGERIFPLKLGSASAQQAATLGMSTLFAARGLGALAGAFAAAGFARSNPGRLRWTILMGFLLAGAGYVALGTVASTLAIAALTLMAAHSGGSACWTSSTTLLQQQTEDRFRGRVFSAEAAGMTLALSAASFIAGKMVDAGVDPRTVAIGTGVVTLVPAALWVAGTRRRV
ncbi:MAG: MFS transporter [Acidobacteriota bacterium]|nr:MFS transporter [Acidobacteriota bacterium]